MYDPRDLSPSPLSEMLEKYRDGERGMPTYDELAALLTAQPRVSCNPAENATIARDAQAIVAAGVAALPGDNAWEQFCGRVNRPAAAAAPQVVAYERAVLEDARNAAYPVPDSPHASVNLRAVADRTAFTRGWKARVAVAAAPVQANALFDAYRALQNTLLVVPDGEFKRKMDDWLSQRLGVIGGEAISVPAPVQAQEPFHHYGLGAEQLQQLLDGGLKPEEISGADDVQHDRVHELVWWFARLTQGNANAKWAVRHACELAYFVATNGVNSRINLKAIRDAAFKEGVNITPGERGTLERIGFAIPRATTAPIAPVQPVAVPDANAVKQAVNRFLGWTLPLTFSPDNGIQFDKPPHLNFWPIGTNLFTADQAKAMFEYCLAAPAAQGDAKDASLLDVLQKAIGWCEDPGFRTDHTAKQMQTLLDGMRKEFLAAIAAKAGAS